MRRLLTALTLLAALAGCDEPLRAGPPTGLPDPGVRAGFPRGGIADVIRIDALDNLPLRTAELIAPDGAASPANFVEAQQAPRVRGGSTVANGAWLGQLTGPGGAQVALNPPIGATMYSDTQLLMTVSTAEIPLPDPVAYRRDWAAYRIRLGFGAPGGQIDTRTIAAPEPPPPPKR